LTSITNSLERLLAEKDYIITALCEVSNRCSVCYQDIDGANCESCDEYYAECTCKPLTPKQIVDGDDISPCPRCGCETVVSKDDNWICEKCSEVIV